MFAHHHRRFAARFVTITPTPNIVAARSGSDLVLPKPSSTQPGDLLISVACATSGTWTPASGFSEVVDSNAMQICTREADGSEGSSFTFTHSGSGSNRAGAILRIPGGALDTVGAVSATDTAAGITVVGGLLIGAFFANGGLEALGTPSGMSLLDYDGTEGTMAIFEQRLGPGSTGNRTSNNAGHSVLFAVKGA